MKNKFNFALLARPLFKQIPVNPEMFKRLKTNYTRHGVQFSYFPALPLTTVSVELKTPLSFGAKGRSGWRKANSGGWLLHDRLDRQADRQADMKRTCRHVKLKQEKQPLSSCQLTPAAYRFHIANNNFQEFKIGFKELQRNFLKHLAIFL